MTALPWPIGRPAPAHVAAAAARVSGDVLADAEVVAVADAGGYFFRYELRTAAGPFVLNASRVVGAGRMNHLLSVTRLLASHGVPHVPVRWIDSEGRFLSLPFFIEDLVPGEDAGRRWPKLGPDERAASARTLGAIVRRLHRIAYADTELTWRDEFGERLRVHVAECRKIGALTPGEAEEVLASWEAGRWALDALPRVLVHRNLSPERILCADAGDGVLLLDFTRARGADPALDLAVLRELTFRRFPWAEAPFADGYGGDPGGQRGAAERDALYRIDVCLVATIRDSEIEAAPRLERADLVAALRRLRRIA